MLSPFPPHAITTFPLDMGTSECNQVMSPHSEDISQRRDRLRPGADPISKATPPTTICLTPGPRTGEHDAHFFDAAGAETDSSALASLDIDLEGDDFQDPSSCSPSDVDGPSSLPGPHSPRYKKRRGRNGLRRLLSPDNVQFLYDDAADMNGGASSEDHSAEYTHATYLQKSPLDVPIIAPRERSITQEGSSPSTILPGNALQLHLPDGGNDGVCDSTPAATSSSSCSSNHPPTVHINQPLAPGVSLDDDQAPVVAIRHTLPRVHFRSRVRITSGLHSNNRFKNRDGASRDSTTGIETANTSASGSPSSSISAPLRYQGDENNVLGPLGKRINYLAQTRNKRNGRVRKAVDVGSSASERTPFLRASEYGPVPDYTRRRRERGRIGCESEDEDSASGLKCEEDIIFGQWPWRIFNSHWLAYQCEPILCCCSDNRFEDDP